MVVNDLLLYQFLADTVLLLHVLVVLFVVGGLGCIVWGNVRGWQWVNAVWFRLVHLATIGVVVAETWLGIVCPLTTLEMWFRSKAGSTTYAGSFVQHWLQSLLYWEASPWVFAVVYTLFGLAVVLAWWYFPPAPWRKAGKSEA